MKNKIITHKTNERPCTSRPEGQYWSWTFTKGTNSEGECIENVRANPDSLEESYSYFAPCDGGESLRIRRMKKELRRTLKSLPVNEVKIANMLACGKYTVRSMAKQIGVSSSTVQYYINKLRKLLAQNLKSVL